MCTLCNFVQSTIGRKILMALTGLVLVLFVMGHMLGNLQIFIGPDVIKGYASLVASLCTMGRSFGLARHHRGPFMGGSHANFG